MEDYFIYGKKSPGFMYPFYLKIFTECNNNACPLKERCKRFQYNKKKNLPKHKKVSHNFFTYTDYDGKENCKNFVEKNYDK